MTPGRIEGRVIQDGQPVAGVSGLPSDVRRELRRLAMGLYE